MFGHFEPVIPAFAEVQPRLADGRSERVAATSAGDEVCLRGGTAQNLGFLNLPRLSVDVDLDDVGSTDSADAAPVAGSAAPDLDIVRTVLVVRGAGYPPPSPATYLIGVVRCVTPSAWKSQVLALARRPCPVTLGGAQADAVRLLSQVLELEPGHLAFLKALADGEIRPETLPLDGIHDRVRANPALRWRLQTGAEALEER